MTGRPASRSLWKSTECLTRSKALVTLHDLPIPCNDPHLVQLDGYVTLDHDNEDLTSSLSPVNDLHLDPLEGSVTLDPENVDHTPELSPVILLHQTSCYY